MRVVFHIWLALHIMLAVNAAYAAETVKDPLAYPPKAYGMLLLMAIFGGFVSWYGKVRRNEISAASVFHFIGELATSAFTGLLAAFICEAAAASWLTTIATVGMSGHMGAKLLGWAEEKLTKFLEKKAEALDV